MSRASKEKMRRQLARSFRELRATGQPIPTRESTAWHEAAHAVVAEYFDFPVEYVTCEPQTHKGETYLGYCMGSGNVQVGLAGAWYGLMHAYAGFVCEWRRGTMKRGFADPRDFDGARETLDQLQARSKGKDIFEVVCGCTEEFLEWAWDVVGDVAAQLLANGRMEGVALREMVRMRLGYIPRDKQHEMWQGVVTQPGSEASTREPWWRKESQP